MFTSPLKRKQLKTNPSVLKAYFHANDSILNLIGRFGVIERVVYQDPFVILVDTIVSQQIATKTKNAIMNKLETDLGNFDAQKIAQLNEADLRNFGISKQKAATLIHISQDIVSKNLDLDALKNQPSSDIIDVLIAYKGIGIWTCEMMLLFAYEKEDIISYHDFGIRKGIEILRDNGQVTKEIYQEFAEEIKPYGSQISFYLWALAQTS